MTYQALKEKHDDVNKAGYKIRQRLETIALAKQACLYGFYFHPGMSEDIQQEHFNKLVSLKIINQQEADWLEELNVEQRKRHQFWDDKVAPCLKEHEETLQKKKQVCLYHFCHFLERKSSERQEYLNELISLNIIDQQEIARLAEFSVMRRERHRFLRDQVAPRLAAPEENLKDKNIALLKQSWQLSKQMQEVQKGLEEKVEDEIKVTVVKEVQSEDLSKAAIKHSPVTNEPENKREDTRQEENVIAISQQKPTQLQLNTMLNHSEKERGVKISQHPWLVQVIFVKFPRAGGYALFCPLRLAANVSSQVCLTPFRELKKGVQSTLSFGTQRYEQEYHNHLVFCVAMLSTVFAAAYYLSETALKTCYYEACLILSLFMAPLYGIARGTCQGWQEESFQEVRQRLEVECYDKTFTQWPWMNQQCVQHKIASNAVLKEVVVERDLLVNDPKSSQQQILPEVPCYVPSYDLEEGLLSTLFKEEEHKEEERNVRDLKSPSTKKFTFFGKNFYSPSAPPKFKNAAKKASQFLRNLTSRSPS